MTGERQAIITYCSALERLHPDTLDAVLELCAAEIEFRDPFNHTVTRERFRDVLSHMFKSVRHLKFRIDRVAGEDKTWIVKWVFSGKVRFIGSVETEGLSEIVLDNELRVVRHIDYWDSRTVILDRIPVVGALLRLILKPNLA